jgi:IclR family transcriptional regulator, acetate operon repressor
MCENRLMAGSRPGAQSVQRAIAVLRAIESGAELGMRISEVAQRTGLGVSTAHRLARALCDAGLVVQDPATEHYQLGPALVVLGQRAERALGYDRLRPVLAQLVDDTQESANLGILSGGEVLVVLGIPSPQPLRYEQEAGSRVPAHTSAMGKALLAHAPDRVAAVRELGTLTRHTERTICEPEALLAHLEQVREQGWALNDGERDPGVRAVGAPVLTIEGRAVAAVAVQGPAVRLPDDRLPGLADAVTATAQRMASLLT